jgi:hypothetical protein
MKPRSLFDVDAWVNREFKPAPRPATPIVRLDQDPELRVEKVVEKVEPFPPSERARPYQTGCSPIVRQTIQAVAAMAGVPMHRIVSERRTGDIVIVRQIAIWIARQFTNRSLKAIASEVGGRDHTTIMHAVQRIDKLIADHGIEAEEETPEAWTRALLAYHQKDQEKRRRAYAERQVVLKRARDQRRRAAGLPVIGERKS